MTNTPIAYMCEGALYCPEHCEPTQEALDDSFMTPITQDDVDEGTDRGEWLNGSICSGCGVSLLPIRLEDMKPFAEIFNS